MVKVTERLQKIGVVLYSLPFLGVIVFSLFFMWAGGLEMVVTGAALVPAVLYFVGFRWCRYVVAVISALGVVAGILRAIPALTQDQGRYFWVIWSPIWGVFVFSMIACLMPVREKIR